jgi:Uma2 family endonuclease
MEESDVSVSQGVVMSATVEEQVRRVPMTLDAFLAHEWAEGERAEWTNGVAVVSPIARKAHQLIAKRLARAIEDGLEGIEAFQEGGLALPNSRRIADVVAEVVGDATSEEHWVPVMPLIVGEVISPSSRTEDRVRKLNEYLAGGIAYYLLADRFERTLIVLRSDGGTWQPVLELDEGTPAGELSVGEYGVVAFDLTTLFAF